MTHLPNTEKENIQRMTERILAVERFNEINYNGADYQKIKDQIKMSKIMVIKYSNKSQVNTQNSIMAMWESTL